MTFDAWAWRPLGAIIALSIAPVLWFVLAADPVDEPTAYATLAVVACAVATISAWALFPRFFSLDAISLPSLFAISTFALIVFPLPVVVGLLPEWHWPTWIGAVAAAYVLTLLGIVSYALASRSESNTAVRIRHRALEGEAFVAIGLLAISLLATAYWMIEVRDFALFTALRGGATAGELLELREGAHKLLEGPIARVVTYLRGLVFPFTTTMLLVIALTKRRLVFWLVFAISFTANFLVAVLSLEKLYAVMLLLQCLFAWLLFSGKRVRYSIILTAVIIVALIYLLVYRLTTDPDEPDLWLAIISGLIWRVGIVNSAIVGSYVDYFQTHDFLMGRSLPFLSKLFSHTPWIENEICRTYWGGADNCHANVAYLGYLWADFGWFGVTIGAFIVGLIIAAVHAACASVQPSASAVALRTTTVVYAFTISISAFGQFATWSLMAIAMALFVNTVAAYMRQSAPAQSAARLPLTASSAS